jgi:uncharacterized membrane protein
MEDAFFILIPLAILLVLVIGSILGFVAVRRVRRLTETVETLSARLGQLSARLDAAEHRPAEAAPPPTVEEAVPSAPEAAPEIAPAAAAEPVEETIAEAAESAAEMPKPPSGTVPDEEIIPEAPVPPPPPSYPPPAAGRPGLEEALGTRWAVWIGGLALALGGVFLVRYSIEAGLIGPGMRIIAGLLFAAALLAAGEWLRRSGAAEAPAAMRGAYVPGVLTGAGIVAAFATTYAAYVLYGFLGGTSAFLALGAVAFACLALSLLHGPAIAGLGLAASYVTPFLVSTTDPSLGGLAVYLVAVTVATLAVARLRGWRWLAVTGTLGTVLWSAFMSAVSGAGVADAEIVAGFTAVCFGLAVVTFVASVHGYAPGRGGDPDDRVAVAVLAAFALPVLVHAGAFPASSTTLALVVGFGAATMTAAYGAGAVRWLVPFGIAVVLAGFVMTTVVPNLGYDPTTGLSDPTRLPPLVTGAPATRLVGTATILGLFFGGLGLLGVAGSASRAMLAVGGTTIPLGLLVLAYLALSGFTISVPSGFTALGLAGFFALTADRVARRLPAAAPGVDGTVAAYAVATVAALAAGLSMLFERGVLTIALAAIVPALAMVEASRPVRALRPLALVVSAVVVARFVIDPEVVGNDLGTTPVFNWLLWGYGVPALAFALAAWRFGLTREDRAVHVLEALAVTFTTLTVVVLIHHAMTGGDLNAPIFGIVEAALHAMVLMAVSLGMQWISVRRPSPVFGQGTLFVGGLGLVVAGFGLLVWNNPVFTGEWITGGAFDWRLIVGYLGPAALAALLARVAIARPDRPVRYAGLAAGLSGGLVFAYATLAIRAAWHSGDLGWSLFGGAGIEEGELYTYSVVWLVFGVALLGLGVRAKSQFVRMVAGALIGLVVGKVFLVDTAGLTGALRAVSFIGLGAVLVLVGLAYQRFLRHPAPPGVSPP